MDTERIFRKPKLLRTLTTLEVGEFERLLAAFDAVWQAQRRERTHDGQVRQRKLGGGFKGTLPTTRAKLFFVLFYCKCYPLQEVMAVLFGLSQGQVSHWVGVLTPLVNAALGRELLLPARRPADLEKLLTDVPELRLLILDGAARPIRRPKDKQRKKDDYSGKKKAHRKKNLLLSSHARRIVYLSPTAPGSVHDKKLADESVLTLPADAVVLQDTGFQGHAVAGAQTYHSPVKSRGAGSCLPTRGPSTRSSAACGWASSTPSAGSNAAALSPTRSAAGARAWSMKSCSRPAVCRTCVCSPAKSPDKTSAYSGASTQHR